LGSFLADRRAAARSLVFLFFVDVVLREVECFEVLVAGTLPTVHQAGDFVLLLDLATAVVLHEVINRQVAASNSDHDSLALNLHENTLAVVAIDALAFAFEVHLASQFERLAVDEVCEVLINRVVTQRFVHKCVFLNLFLQLSDLLVQPFNLLISNLHMLKQLQTAILRVLAFLLNLEQVV
jgi:hypothetical protein